MQLPKLIFETDTQYGHYQVWDLQYDNRPSRVLYSGKRQTAQSGIAYDDNHDLLFDYNQRFYELVSGVLPKRLLLIGGGMYTLPTALRAVMPNLEIDVVEIDEQLAPIAERFFALKPDSRLHLIHDDGRHFLDTNNQPYDMILIDAFMNAEIPEALMDQGGIKALRQNLRPKGIVAINSIAAYHGPNSRILARRLEMLAQAFSTLQVFPASKGLSLWLPQNLVIIAQGDAQWPVEQFLRYPSLDSQPPIDVSRDLRTL